MPYHFDRIVRVQGLALVALVRTIIAFIQMSRDLHFTDLDELIQTVHSSRSRKYITEAIKTYRSGAYRSCIVATWIAVCTDIIHKIELLKNNGDSRVNQLYDQIEKCIGNPDEAKRSGLELELLDKAKEIELISPLEKDFFERLKSDRNLCAHPALFKEGELFEPDPELARLYIIQACKFLLCSGPIQGKNVIQSIKSLIESNSLSSKEEEIKEILFSPRYIEKATTSTIRNLIIVLLKYVFKENEKLSKEIIEKIALIVKVLFSKEKYFDIAEETFKKFFKETDVDQDQTRLYRFFVFLNCDKSFWSYIENHTKVLFKHAIRDVFKDEDLIKYFVADSIYGIPELEEVFYEKAKTIYSAEAFGKKPYPLLKDIIIEKFSMVGGFDSAYEKGLVLVRYVELLNSSDLKKILENALNHDGSAHQGWSGNQIVYAGRIDEVFIALFDGTAHLIEHSEIWNDFLERLKEKYPNTCLLEKLLAYATKNISDPLEVPF